MSQIDPSLTRCPGVEEVHETPEDQRHCPHDGQVLPEINQVVSEQLDVILAQIRVIRHIRKQHAKGLPDLIVGFRRSLNHLAAIGVSWSPTLLPTIGMRIHDIDCKGLLQQKVKKEHIYGSSGKFVGKKQSGDG